MSDLFDAPNLNALRQRRYRQTPAGKVRHRAENRQARIAHRLSTPFVGVDGEGAGTNEMGQQNYLLLRAGERELMKEHGTQRLTTRDCLDFICCLPRGPIYVGFAFGYDTTMILRDLPKDRLDRMFLSDAGKRAIEAEGRQLTRYVHYQDFGIEYIPRNYLRVCRLKNGKPIPNSSRTIYETFGFFQCSFLKALKQFDIVEEKTLEEIEAMKEARATFRDMNRRVRYYCALECDLLAKLMTRFREICYAGNIRPRTWNGAGKLAAALHTDHRTPRKTELVLPDSLMSIARSAYYGGRFEVTQIGEIPGPIHEYDIRSAYPAAMQKLPCLLHGRWQPHDFEWRRIEDTDEMDLFVAQTRFVHAKHTHLCGLPIRSKQQRLFWPREGQGVYWSVELAAAMRLGAHIRLGELYEYHRECDCQPFAWVKELYEYRRSIGSAAQGYPIKLGINSLYGQLARRIGGGGPWQNHLWAGLITAQTRAWLAEAAAVASAEVVMLATDGIYSRVPLGVAEGTELGQWEHAEHPRMFVVQPGLYWGPPRPKTRGVPRGFFEPYTPVFERAWHEYMETETAARTCLHRLERLPAIPIAVTNFIGLRLAHAWGKPERAGVWDRTERIIAFDWSQKRDMASAKPAGGRMATWPRAGSPDLVSVAFQADDDVASIAAELRQLTEALPDFADFGPPGF